MPQYFRVTHPWTEKGPWKGKNIAFVGPLEEEEGPWVAPWLRDGLSDTTPNQVFLGETPILAAANKATVDPDFLDLDLFLDLKSL